MFQNLDLKSHIEESSTVDIQSLVIAEWNLNDASNIALTGNYRYRPTDATSKYKTIINTFDSKDTGNFYTDATSSSVSILGGFDDEDIPQLFTSVKTKEKQLYSLESCTQRFRPRSGINKVRYFDKSYLHHSNSDMANRPRFYLGSKDDYFKYWTSYRFENLYKYIYTSGKVEYGQDTTFIDDDAKNTIKDGTLHQSVERGIAKNISNGNNYIDDAAPFVVYKEQVPANRLVVKMQTGVGSVNLGPFSSGSGVFTDPFYGTTNAKIPSKWKIQILKNKVWIDAISFTSNSKRDNGNPVIGSDGYVELSYGLIIPNEFKASYVFAGYLTSESLLPAVSVPGYGYIVTTSSTDIGTLFIWNGSGYSKSTPNYGWGLEEETVDTQTKFLNRLVNPRSFMDTVTQSTKYREFEYITGMRVVVDTMNKFDSTFDLIEMSPRLLVNISGRVSDFSVTKMASDIGNTGMPVGQLLASTGTLAIFDYDEAFTETNTQSIVKEMTKKNLKFSFYDIFVNVSGYDYYVPIKTLYSEGIPKANIKDKTINIELRDMYFYFESISAPSLLLTNVSLTFAIATLLDSIGFTNYSFKKISGQAEMIIPYFFVSPDKTVAQVLNDLAISSQTSMFFDEYNNFILMSKEYIMPSVEQRATDLVLYGTEDPNNSDKLSSIISIASVDNKIYNDGKIKYTTRYIQKSYGSIKQASMIDQDKTWIYKPALLWEVSGTENTKSINDQVNKMSSYVLGAMPLRSDLSDSVPTVVGNKLTNNIMDLGENVYWLTRYNGYFYSNGEIIKYDAAQFNISKIGNVWIKDVQEYQNYFSKLPFNGKIYPTGLVRIYSEPDYETVNGITKLKNGAVKKHGRGQFGTTITNHQSGLNSYWTDNNNVQGCQMESKYLFGSDIVTNATDTTAAGLKPEIAKQMTRTGIIKNFLTNSYITDGNSSKMLSTQSGTVQSSALVMSGPAFATGQKPIDYINYVYKPLDNKYKHFGTRMRIIGKVEANGLYGQTPVGSSTYYVLPDAASNQNINVGGGSGGLGVMLNPLTNAGYYFELVALTDNTVDQYTSSGSSIHNIIFYKIKKDTVTSTAVPIKLWSGLSKIVCDDGNFTGQYRMTGETTPTVYDIAVEYVDSGTTRKFYLYVNNVLITEVEDKDPLPIYNNMALFVRGSSKVMFENIFALSENYALDTSVSLDLPMNKIFSSQEISANDAFRKYAMSAMVQSTYLSGLSPSQPPSYKLYFDEFGSIMRECAYFNIRYDKAYPAIYAKISPTFNNMKTYTVSGFQADPYGAEFLIFNATDSAISLDESSGNYLRIQGVTFTQDTTHELSVDEYYSNKSDFSNPQLASDNSVRSPYTALETYNNVKLSRLTYGTNQFTLEVPYVQSQDDANNLMGWMTSKLIKPRKSVGIQIFSNSTIQLGDIVSLYYKRDDGTDVIATESTRFVVYNISYNRGLEGPSMSLYLSEIIND